MKKTRKLTCCVLSALLVTLSMSGFSGNAAKKRSNPIVLNYMTYRCGQNVGAKYFLPSVSRFNKKYAGKYKVVISECTQDSYDTKIKQLALAHKLPSLMDGMHDTAWLRNYAAKNNIAYNLKGWLNKNPAVKKLCIKESLDWCTINGKVDFMPIAISNPEGLYYNSSMYKPSKKIRDMSADQFYNSLGNNKMAFMTSENAWTTELFYSSLIASQKGGAKLLNSHAINKITNFNTSIFINATTKLQKFLKNKASSNTVGAAYADAANSFMSKQSAVICNGPWMFDNFRAASKDKWSNGFSGNDAHCDIYPNNIAICFNANTAGYWIPSYASAKQLEAALAFLKFEYSQNEIEQQVLIAGGYAQNLKYSSSFKKSLNSNRLLKEYESSMNSKTTYVADLNDVVPASVAQPGLSNLLPDLASGNLTPQQFCAKLTALAKQAS